MQCNFYQIDCSFILIITCGKSRTVRLVVIEHSIHNLADTSENLKEDTYIQK